MDDVLARQALPLADGPELRDAWTLQTLHEHLPATIWTVDHDLRVTMSAGEGLRRAGWTANHTVGRTLYEHFGTTDPSFPPIDAHRRALRGETAHYEGRITDATTRVTVEPLRDDDGEIAGCIALSVAVSDHDREAELFRLSEERFRQFAENLDKVVWMSDATLRRLTYVSRAYEVIWGRSREELMREPERIIDAVHPEDRAILSAAIERHRRGRRAEVTYRIVRPDGAVRWIRDNSFPIRDASGRITRAAGIAEDVTEQRQAQTRQQLMMRELDHRVKNNLAVVMSIAQQTAASSDSMDEFISAFNGRLHSLSIAHELLAQSKWDGAGLEAMAGRIIEPHRGESPDRVALVGPPVLLAAEAAPPLSMVLHELTTNAAKHGALRVPEGRIEIRWSIRTGDGRPRLYLVWNERHGPAVTPPNGRGLGLAIVQGLVERQLRGTLRTELDPAGFRAELTVPLDAPVPSRPVSGSWQPDAAFG